MAYEIVSFCVCVFGFVWIWKQNREIKLLKETSATLMQEHAMLINEKTQVAKELYNVYVILEADPNYVVKIFKGKRSVTYFARKENRTNVTVYIPGNTYMPEAEGVLTKKEKLDRLFFFEVKNPVAGLILLRRFFSEILNVTIHLDTKFDSSYLKQYDESKDIELINRANEIVVFPRGILKIDC